jgi:hypothetical protein
MGTALFIAACAASNLLALTLQHFLIAKPLGVDAEMAEGSKTGLFRPLTGPLALYFPLLAPAVQAALTRALAVGLFGAPSVAAWTRGEGARFAIGLWAATTAHGIWLDFTTFRISPRMLARFLLGSLVTAAITGALLPLAF